MNFTVDARKWGLYYIRFDVCAYRARNILQVLFGKQVYLSDGGFITIGFYGYSVSGVCAALRTNEILGCHSHY